MRKPILIIIVILIIYLLVKELTTLSTAKLADSASSISPIIQNGSFDTDGGLSPIDIGGISLNIPSLVLSWQSLAEKYANQFSILDPEEILAIIWNESSGNPNASNLNDPSFGLMGVTILIGNAYAGTNTATKLFDPETNIKAGSAFLAHIKSRFSDDPNWVDAYNEGETNFAKGIVATPGYVQAFNEHVNALRGLG